MGVGGGAEGYVDCWWRGVSGSSLSEAESSQESGRAFALLVGWEWEEFMESLLREEESAGVVLAGFEREGKGK